MTSGPSQATQLVELALRHVDLFHAPDQTAYANLVIEGHRETWPLRTGPFRRWLARRFFDLNAAAPSAQPLQDALGVLEGHALFDGEEHPVFTRLAASSDELIFLDLGEEHWGAVEVGRGRWEIVEPPVFFRRPRGLLALPRPTRGGDLEELRAFVNVSDPDWPLLVAWLLAAIRPRGPYPLLLLHGEQGAAKSTTARVLRALIDPNTAPLRSQPREERDLMIAARNGWVLAFDNVSSVPDWLSDAFCRLSTGGGLATRMLYTDDDEVIFEAQRPLLLTGIEEVATRSDLLDRSLILFLPRIGRPARRVEEDLWEEFIELRPRLLGALLDAAAAAAKGHRSVRLDRLPRMADFARWVVAAEPVLRWGDGVFLDAYAGKQAAAHELTLEASVIAPFVRAQAAEGFSGTATHLLDLLNARLGELPAEDMKELRRNGWPKDARRLSGALRRIAPDLRAVGLGIDFHENKRPRLIELRTEGDSSVGSDAAAAEPKASDGAAATSHAGSDAADAADADFPTRSREAARGGGREE